MYNFKQTHCLCQFFHPFAAYALIKWIYWIFRTWIASNMQFNIVKKKKKLKHISHHILINWCMKFLCACFSCIISVFKHIFNLCRSFTEHFVFPSFVAIVYKYVTNSKKGQKNTLKRKYKFQLYYFSLFFVCFLWSTRNGRN